MSMGSDVTPAESLAHNPFRPTFGTPPLQWVGRGRVLDAFRDALDSHAGSPGRSLIISGARGIGKTVLLNELEDVAISRGWITLRTSGRTKIVDELVETTIPRITKELSPFHENPDQSTWSWASRAYRI